MNKNFRFKKSRILHFGVLMFFAFQIVLTTGAFSLFSNFAKVSADEQAPSSSQTLVSTSVTSSVYNSSSGYSTSSVNKISETAHPMGDSWLSYSLTRPQTVELNKTTYNNSQAFGIDNSLYDGDTSNILSLDIAYKYADLENRNGQAGWNIVEDGSTTVLGQQVGVIKKGSLYIQKSFNGTTWDIQNPFTAGTTGSYYTTNFASTFKPDKYTANNKLKIYQPLGEDIARGVYIRAVFAYKLERELVRHSAPFTNNWTEWMPRELAGSISILRSVEYKTERAYIVEQATFFIASDSGVVTFNNVMTNERYVSSGLSEILYYASTIKNNHVSASGFRLNSNNESFKITYSYNGGAYTSTENGKMFFATGKYDFIVETLFGTKNNYTVFIDRRELNTALYDYFGGISLIKDNSHRVFSVEDEYPVYLAGKAYYNIAQVSENHVPLVGTITNIETNSVINIDYTRQSKQGTLTEPGYYVAELYNNPDYDGDMSGDLFKFTFIFKLVTEQSHIIKPMVNYELLSETTSIADLQAGYYGVKLSTQGAGHAVFAFSTYSEAYNFSYNYEKSLVQLEGASYIYKDINNPTSTTTYYTNSEALQAITHFAENNVEKRYFDATNSKTYQTLDTNYENVLSLELNEDVVVFASEDALENLKSSQNFVNNRKYRVYTSNNEMYESTNYFKFINVADWESETIYLVNELTNVHYKIDYDIPVEQQMLAYSAPSGNYKVKETNIYGIVSEYSATYIKPTDITASIDIETFTDGETKTTTYDKNNISNRVVTNGFKLVDAKNIYDNHSIVKVTKNNNTAQMQIMEINEVYERVYDQAGEYEVKVIDRLGNSFSLYITIINAKQAYIVSFETEDYYVFDTYVFSGQQITLPTPQVAQDKHEFIGWELNGQLVSNTFTLTQNANITLTERVQKTLVDVTYNTNTETVLAKTRARVGTTVVLPTITKEGFVFAGWDINGKTYKTTYTLQDNQDLTASAVWHHPKTTITLLDGNFSLTVESKPDNKYVLPQVSNGDYELFGWLNVYENQFKFYVGQITKVPNVSEMALIAVWKDKNGDITPVHTPNKTTITLVTNQIYDVIVAEENEVVTLPKLTNNNLAFFGWVHMTGDLSGTVYYDDMEIQPTSQSIMLEALWIKKVVIMPPMYNKNIAGSIVGSGIDKLMNNLTTLSQNVWEHKLEFLSVVVLILLAAVMLKQPKTKNYYRKQTIKQKHIGYELVETNNQQALEQNYIKAKSIKTKHTLKGFATWFKNAFTFKTLQTTTAVLLMIVSLSFGILAKLQETGFTFENDSYAVTTIDDDNTTQLYQEFVSPQSVKQLHENNKLASLNNGLYVSNNNEASGQNESFGQTPEDILNNSQIELTEDEAFIFNLVLTDLTTLGYITFNAYAITENEEIIEGFAYTTFEDSVSSEDGLTFFETGFISLTNDRVITFEEIESSLIIIMPTFEEYDLEEFGIGFALTFTESYPTSHFIYNDKYMTYSVDGTAVNYTISPNDVELYNYENGSLYSFDLGRYIYDADLGKQVNIGAYALNALSDYAVTKSQFQAFITNQNLNNIELETVEYTYISVSALNEVILGNQSEEFIGINTNDILYFESQIENSEYYAVTEDGTLTRLSLPPTDEEKQQDFLNRLYGGLVAAGIVALGVIICVSTCGLGTIGAAVIMGAAFGAASSIFGQTTIGGKSLAEVNYASVIISGIAGAVSGLAGGLSSVATLGKAAKAGLYLLGMAIDGTENFVTTMLEGGSVEDALLSAAIGVVTQIGIALASKALGKLLRKIGKHCFIAGTLVLMANGTYKPIEQVVVGDIVVSYNETLNRFENDVVTETYMSVHTSLVQVAFGGQTITSSVNHPYFTNRGWVPASGLTAGDILLPHETNELQEQIVVESANVYNPQSYEILYNFEVQGNHTYLVTSSQDQEAVVVHNACDPNNLMVEPNRGKVVREAKKRESLLISLQMEDLDKRGIDLKTYNKFGTGKYDYETAMKFKNGNFKGYQGHHINSVKAIKNGMKNTDWAMLGDTNNIIVLTNKAHLVKHGGNFQNTTVGKMLNREKLIEDLLKKLGK